VTVIDPSGFEICSFTTALKESPTWSRVPVKAVLAAGAAAMASVASGSPVVASVLVTSRPLPIAAEALAPATDAVHVLLATSAEKGPGPTALARAELVTVPPSPVVPSLATAIDVDWNRTAGPYCEVAPSVSVADWWPPLDGRVTEGLHAVDDLASQPAVPAGPLAMPGPPKWLTLA
jgi:hypothetical protein